MGVHSALPRPRRDWSLLRIGAAWALVLVVGTVIAVGWNASWGPRGDRVTELVTRPTPAVTRTVEATPSRTKAPRPRVSPRAEGVRGPITSGSVLRQTDYVRTYRRLFPFAYGHTDKGLAVDGAELCNVIMARGADRSEITKDLIEDEREDGTPISAPQARAVIDLVLVKVCPGRRSAWEHLP